MVNFADYAEMEPEEQGDRCARAAMALLNAIQEQINFANLPGIKPVSFFMIVQLEDRTGRVPICFPLYSSEDPVTNLGLLQMANMLSTNVMMERP